MFKKVLGNLFLSSTKYFIAICVMTQAFCSEKEEEQKTSTSPHSSMISEVQNPYFGNSQFLPNFEEMEKITKEQYIGNPIEKQLGLKEYREAAWNLLKAIRDPKTTKENFLENISNFSKYTQHYALAEHGEFSKWINHLIKYQEADIIESLDIISLISKNIPGKSLLSILSKMNTKEKKYNEVAYYTIQLVPVYNEDKEI